MASELESEAAELRNQIERLTARLNRVEAKSIEQALEGYRQDACVRIVCPHCDGRGETYQGVDTLDTYPVPRDACCGEGFIWAPKWHLGWSPPREGLAASLYERVSSDLLGALS